tara:strand:- start:172 stop:345 length:174 start_codon:yes stop_codon:yes gene_type:complete
MKSYLPYLWALFVLTVAVLNILDVLPDWTTFAAILTLPALSAWNCLSRRESTTKAAG